MATLDEKRDQRANLIIVLVSCGSAAVMVGAVVIAFAVSWWTSRADESPEGRVKALIKWADKGDPGELQDFLPPSHRSPGNQIMKALESRDPSFRRDGSRAFDNTMDDFSVAIIRMAILTKLAKCRIVDVIVVGDEARVLLNDPDGKKDEFPLIRESGRWYVNL